MSGEGRPRLPLIPTPWDLVVLAWRRLRRMSTALGLLFVLAIATLVATFIPQEPVIATTVREWREGTAGPGAGIARVFDWLSLFDVFGSPWFAVITGLLLLSLSGCLIPRWRAFTRNVSTPPVRGGNLDRLTHRVVVERPPGAEAEVILDAARRMLRRFRSRVIELPDGRVQLAASRGHWREAGSLMFHTSFYLLLLGVVLAGAFSFTGQIDIVEGGVFADTPLGYQTQVAGRWWDTADHDGHLTRIDDFEVTYLDDGFTPDEFVTTATFTDPGTGRLSTQQIRVNHPGRFGALTYYQRAFGFAPRVVLRSGLDGQVLFEEAMVLRDDGGFWTGRAKVSQGAPGRGVPQIAMEVVLIPDGRITPEGAVVFNSPEANDPRLLVTLYSGEDLGLDRAVPTSRLVWTEDDVVDRAMITPDGSVPLVAGLFEVEVTDVEMWTGLQVSHQPFRWLILTAASITLIGLVPSLYAYRRRVWVQLEADRIVLAGVAQQRRDRFAEEFQKLESTWRAAMSELAERPAAPLDRTERTEQPA